MTTTPRHSASATRLSTRRAAFTLLELLAAIAIIGLIGASLFASLRIAGRAQESADALVEPSRTADIVFDQLRLDLENAQPQRSILCGEFVGSNYLDDRGRDADTVLFFTTAPGAEHTAGDGEIRRVEYIVLASDDGTDHMLIRRVTHNLLSPYTPPYDDEVLVRSLGAFNIVYSDGITPSDDWSSNQNGSLPAMMRIDLALERVDRTTNQPVMHSFARYFQLPCSVPQTSTSGLSGLGR